MDRLQEANKVASLMRRRENLKPIANLQPVEASVMENRSFPAAKAATTPGVVIAFSPVPAALPTPRVIDSPMGCVTLQSRGLAGEARARSMERKRVRLRPASPVVPPAVRKVNSTVRLQQAKLTMPRNLVAPREIGRRLLDMLRMAKRKPALSKSMMQRNRLVAGPFKQACNARHLDTNPVAGRDLRVSQSQGFRPPKPRRRAIAIAPRRRSSLIWNDSPKKLELRREFPIPKPSVPVPPLVVREPRYPAAPGPFNRAPKAWPAPPRVIRQEIPPRFPVQATLRVSGVRWNTAPLEKTLRCAWYVSQPAITLGYSKEQHKAAAAEPPKAPVLADVRLEENFASGCTNWVGEVSDWRLDAAGARTGSLALFAPSLELIDYEMEFLVRVENRSVVWVFRASDTNDYYRASLRITPEGGYEFTRSAVIAGVAEPAISAPVTLPNNARTALAVRTSVRNKEFAVTIEGQTVDRWTDDRLPIGGVGFGSAPDDRARLYWVRLTHSGSPGMKDVKR
jgi:hypothetical protein